MSVDSPPAVHVVKESATHPVKVDDASDSANLYDNWLLVD